MKFDAKKQCHYQDRVTEDDANVNRRLQKHIHAQALGNLEHLQQDAIWGLNLTNATASSAITRRRLRDTCSQ